MEKTESTQHEHWASVIISAHELKEQKKLKSRKPAVQPQVASVPEPAVEVKPTDELHDEDEYVHKIFDYSNDTPVLQHPTLQVS
jgi:hypothetical protein